MIDRVELNHLIKESEAMLDESNNDIRTAAFNHNLGWHDCLLYLKEEYFGND